MRLGLQPAMLMVCHVQGLFGWVDSIWTDESEVIDDADDEKLKKLEDKYLKHGKALAPEHIASRHDVTCVCVSWPVGSAIWSCAIERHCTRHHVNADHLCLQVNIVLLAFEMMYQLQEP